MTKILVIADEPDMCGPIRDILEHERYFVEVAPNWRDIDEKTRSQDFDAVILDTTSSAMDAAQICRNFRGGGGIAPILILSNSTSDDRVDALDAGADDFLNKPFQLRELTARIRAILRRPAVVYGRILVVDDIILDTISSTVIRQGFEIHLHPMEFNLLEFLMRHPNQVFSADALWKRVWKSDSLGLTGTVRTHVKTLRQKLGEDSSSIITARGKGYKLVAVLAT